MSIDYSGPKTIKGGADLLVMGPRPSVKHLIDLPLWAYAQRWVVVAEWEGADGAILTACSPVFPRRGRAERYAQHLELGGISLASANPTLDEVEAAGAADAGLPSGCAVGMALHTVVVRVMDIREWIDDARAVRA